MACVKRGPDQRDSFKSVVFRSNTNSNFCSYASSSFLVNDLTTLCSWNHSLVSTAKQFWKKMSVRIRKEVAIELIFCYSCNKITKTWIQISHLNWFCFFSSISHQMMVSRSKGKWYKHPEPKKFALNLELETIQISTNNVQTVILCLSCFITTVFYWLHPHSWLTFVARYFWINQHQPLEYYLLSCYLFGSDNVLARFLLQLNYII